MSGHRMGSDHHAVTGWFLRLFNRLNGTPAIEHASKAEVQELRRRQIELTQRVRTVEERLRV